MSGRFTRGVLDYSHKNKKEWDNWVREILKSIVWLDDVLAEAKIPKKFLILEGLK